MSYFQETSGYIQRHTSLTFNDYSMAEVSSTGRLPENRDKMCRLPFAIDCAALTDDEKITLTWTTVGGADGYVVQLCQNTQFVGPTMKGINVGNVLTYALGLQCDIWYGVTYFWRIFAYNDTGGASPKSEVFEFQVVCPDQEETDADDTSLCQDHGVTIALTAPGDQIVCLKQMTSYVTASWNSSNISVESHSWGVTGPASISSSALTYCELNIGVCQNGTVTLTYDLDLLYEGATSYSFTCRESMSFVANGGCGSYNTVTSSYISGFYVNNYGLYLCETSKNTFVDPCGYQYEGYGIQNCRIVDTYVCT